MAPEKKAKELIDKYLMVMPHKNVPNDHAIYGRAKQAAIICVDEMIEFLKLKNLVQEIEYYQQVKTSITNL